MRSNLSWNNFRQWFECGQGRRRRWSLGLLGWPGRQRRKFLFLLGIVAILVLAASEMETMKKCLHEVWQLYFRNEKYQRWQRDIALLKRTNGRQTQYKMARTTNGSRCHTRTGRCQSDDPGSKQAQTYSHGSTSTSHKTYSAARLSVQQFVFCPFSARRWCVEWYRSVAGWSVSGHVSSS